MKVFLSSTAQDLVAHRQVADDTILRLSQDSIAMERFGPLPGEPVAECERKARESDVVVCIVAHRYGFVPEKGKGSITRREVEAAKAAGKDVLVWVVADDYAWAEKKEQDLLADPTVLADPVRIAEVTEGLKSLIEFKTWLRQRFTWATFTTPDDLGRKVAITLGEYLRTHSPSASSKASAHGVVRIVHPLQPAPHFQGRESLLKELGEWVSDLASPDRVWSLVAAGGTGKTAVAERVVSTMKPGEASVLVWSFYDQPDADAFMRACNDVFLGEDDGDPGGRLERLERGIRDGRPRLIVLDGLELVQESGGSGRARGEMSDQSLKLLLRAIAAGPGRTRALVTSRYPLADLKDWENRGYRDTRLDDLSSDAAIAVLRGWGVNGDEGALRAATEQVGCHALSVAVLGSYLNSFADGSIEAVKDFALDDVTGDDSKAAKLARVLAHYAQRLPDDERELLARLSVFPRGVTLDLLGVLVDAGGEVAGLLVQAKPRLLVLLGKLRKRGLVFQYRMGQTVTWTAHPFLRDNFRKLLGCPTERVFDVIAQSLGADLEKRPDKKPIEPVILDQYERLIEVTRLAGRVQDAFELYWHGLGSFSHLGWILGEYERGFRILSAFTLSGRPEDLGKAMSLRLRTCLVNDLALFALKLGRLAEASEFRALDNRWCKTIGEAKETSRGLRNSSNVVLEVGRLSEARELADNALKMAQEIYDPFGTLVSRCFRAAAAHAMGDVTAAQSDFVIATRMEGGPLFSLRGSQYARHLVDLQELPRARSLASHGLERARLGGRKDDLPQFHALLARIELAEGKDPTPHIEHIRSWTSQTGDMQQIIEAHLLAALHLHARRQPSRPRRGRDRAAPRQVVRLRAIPNRATRCAFAHPSGVARSVQVNPVGPRGA